MLQDENIDTSDSFSLLENWNVYCLINSYYKGDGMSSFSIFKNLSSVKSFVYTLTILLALTHTEMGWGQSFDTARALGECVSNNKDNSSERDKCFEVLKKMSQTDKCPASERKSVADALAKACSDAGLTTSKCISESKECQAKSEYAGSSEQFADMLGQLAGVNMGTTMQGSSCPQLSSSSYREKKRDLEKAIEDANKDIKDIQEKMNEGKEKLEEKIQKLKENLDKAKQEYSELSAQMSEEERKQTEELFKVAQERQRNLEQYENQISKQFFVVSQLSAKKDFDAKGGSSERMKIACNAQLDKAKKEYDNAQAGNKSKGNIFAKSNTKKQYLMNLWQQCLEYQTKILDDQIKDSQRKIEEAQEVISNIEADIKRVNEQAKFSEEQVAKKKQADQEKLSQAAQRINQMITDNDNQTITLRQNYSTEVAQATKQIQDLEQKKASKSNLLSQLGLEPPDGTTVAGKRGSSAIEAAAVNAVDFDQRCQTDPSKKERSVIQDFGGSSRK